MDAYELTERVKSEFESNGFKFKAQGSNYYTEHEWKEGERLIGIKPTWRHNGTEENVTVTITVLEIDKIWSKTSGRYKLPINIKVPKNASDKVIKNRVAKAIESYNK